MTRVWCPLCGVVREAVMPMVCDHAAPHWPHWPHGTPREMEPLPRHHPLAPSLGPWWIINMRAPFWESPVAP